MIVTCIYEVRLGYWYYYGFILSTFKIKQPVILQQYSKWVYWGRAENCNWGQANWQNHMQIQRTKDRGLLVLGFRRKLGRVVLNKSSLKKNKSFHWLQAAVSALLLRQGGILLLFRKADELPMRFMFFFLPDGYAGCKEWFLPEVLCLWGFLTPFQTSFLLFTFTIIIWSI